MTWLCVLCGDRFGGAERSEKGKEMLQREGDLSKGKLSILMFTIIKLHFFN